MSDQKPQFRLDPTPDQYEENCSAIFLTEAQWGVHYKDNQPIRPRIESEAVSWYLRIPDDSARANTVSNLARQFVEATAQSSKSEEEAEEIAGNLQSVHSAIYNIYQELLPQTSRIAWAVPAELVNFGFVSAEAQPETVALKQEWYLASIVDLLIKLPVVVEEKDQLFRNLGQDIKANFPKWDITGNQYVARRLQFVIALRKYQGLNPMPILDAEHILGRDFMKPRLVQKLKLGATSLGFFRHK